MSTATLVLRNAQVLDVRTGNYTQADVAMDGDRILEISQHIVAPDSAEEMVLTGKYLVPGLIDGHVHVTAPIADLGGTETLSPTYVGIEGARAMNNMLRRGFTTIRDNGGADFGFALAQEEGLFKGPRLRFCGTAISQTGGHGDFRVPGVNSRTQCCSSVGRVADGIPAVREAVRDELRKGAHHIKIMASGGIASPTDRMDSTQFSVSEIRAIVEEATAANRYVAAHAYTARAVNRCLESGVRSIEHGNLIDESSVELFRKHDAYLAMTLSTHWAIGKEGKQYGMSHEQWLKIGSIFEDGLAALRLATDGGVNIVYATDLLSGMQQYQGYEFSIRARVQSNLQVLQSATAIAAEMMQESGHLGELVEGAVSDAVIVDTDPLEDIEVLAKFEERGGIVIQGGKTVIC